MLTRKTQYAWMALGGLICLFGLVLACKLRDGNKAVAQGEQLTNPPPFLIDKSDLPSPPAKTSKSITFPDPVIGLRMREPEKVLPPKSASRKLTSDPLLGASPSAPPMATLEMPMPELTPKKPMDRPLLSPTSKIPSAASSPVLPVSFGPNTPTAAGMKPHPSPLPIPTPSPQPVFISGLKEASKPPPMPPSYTGFTPPPSSTADKKPAASSLDSLRTLIKKTTTEPSNDTKLAPAAYAPVMAAPPSTTSASDHEASKAQPGEPPLAPAPGPVQLYHVHGRETLQDIARRTLGSSERWSDLHKLNPSLKPDEPLSAGDTVRLPADACVQSDDVEPIKPLPALRPRPSAPKAKTLPLTGTYQCSLDEKGQLTLPRAIREQLSSSDTVLLSPGPDKCLWLTNQLHLERLGERLEQSQAHEADVRVFKRLYFAQTEKLTVNNDGRVAVPERLGQFAGLHQEVVLVGIDDHFEVWDAARWRQYTQQKSTTGRGSASVEPE